MIANEEITRFSKLLSSGDRRSIGRASSVLKAIIGQKEFDQLFECLCNTDRIVVMRAADCVEKVSLLNPGYLAKHKKAILELSRTARNMELKWHWLN